MFKRKHILVVDDDRKLGDLLKSYLNGQGYLVDLARDTSKAKIKMFNIIYDLLILDVMLPNESGLVFATNLKDKLPILMLSAMGDTSDRIKGLKTGVDEYLAKPFEPEELLLRIENVIKRNSQISKDINSIKIGMFSFNLNENSLSINKHQIKLTIKESKVLLYLYKNLGKDVSREKLAEEIVVSSRTIDVLVKRLREKILGLPKAKNILLTSRGIGYKLDP